jgi:glycine betaine catabolism B
MFKPVNLLLHRFTSLIDKFNDRFTSYRLVLYFLMILVGWAAVGGLVHKVPYTWNEILVSAGFLAALCWLTNRALSWFLGIPANLESYLITALILALILSPPKTGREFALVAAAGIAAIASKYLITLRQSHIFNPAAAGAFVVGIAFNHYASWWVGTKFITPVVIIGGLLVLRKTKRFGMAGLFLAVYLLYLIFSNNSGGDLHFLWAELIATPAIFLAVIMLTEPLTSPAQAKYYMSYAILVGLLYSVTNLKLSPEEALLIGNVFTLVLAANRRYEAKFINRVQEAEGIFSYYFSSPEGFNFAAGQYMEWTLVQSKFDSRGNRRYLTIASSPSEPGLMVTIKQPPKASAFKRRLAELKPGDKILASRLAGSFYLPKDPAQKLAFLAGGVGITPFRSMVKYLLDKGEKRDINLIYSATSDVELAFRPLFKQAGANGLKTGYLTEGYLDDAKIRAFIPDFKERTFYVSGPYGFVSAAEASLLKLGVVYDKIVTDYFPGYG